MKNLFALLISMFMIFCFCGSTGPVPPSPSQEPGTEQAPAVLPSPALPEAAESPAPENDADNCYTAPCPSPECTQAMSCGKAPSIFDLVATAAPSTEPAYEVDMAAYYLRDMCAAAARGDVIAGQSAEKSRNAAIDAGNPGDKISFDDLLLLSRLIFSEAGSDWLTEDFRICTGEVVLNRVASPEFPDTIYEVIHQKGQYTGAGSAAFQNLAPGEDCVAAALRLLQGERRMVPSVVYQSDIEQGEIFIMYSDRRLGNTYFCLSPNQELYPID